MKIFLSSTFQDLQEHRKRVMDALDRLRVNGAEIEWLGMEAFGARDDLPSDACVKFVDACDLYVGFFGVRYGSLDPKSKLSMTEVEYRRAVEQKKSRLIFLLSDDATVKQKDIEASPDGQQKLKALKEDLKKDRVVDFFTSPEDLAFKVATALAKHLPITNPQSLIPFPPLPCFAHSYPLQANFTGRASERAMLSDWLTRGERKTEAILSLCAIGGMGKSALAWYWLNNDILAQGVSPWSLAGAFWWSFYDERNFGVFLERAIEYASGGKTNPKELNSDRERVDVLVNLLRESRFLFILDGFERVLRAYARMDAAYRGDEVDADPRNDYRACVDPNVGIFLKCLASGAMLTKMLITTRLHPLELDELDGACKQDLVGLNPADAVAFFHKQGIKGAHTEIENACAAYGFHPLTLRLLAGALKQDPRYHADIAYAPRVDLLEADKDKRMRRMLEFAYNSVPPHEQKLLSQLAAFRNPLKWETIADIFTQSPNVLASRLSKKGSLIQLWRSAWAISTFATTLLTEHDLTRVVSNLVERGLYMRDESTNTFDLHPIIRRYCYDQLAYKPQMHAVFIDYLTKIHKPEKIQTLADLQPTIELYHHTVRAGRYDEAFALYNDRLRDDLYYRFGAYNLSSELLTELASALHNIKSSRDQTWVLIYLTMDCERTGGTFSGLEFIKRSVEINRKNGNRLDLGSALAVQSSINQLTGNLKTAETSLVEAISIFDDFGDPNWVGISHREYARILIERGDWISASEQIAIAEKAYLENDEQRFSHGLCWVWLYRAMVLEQTGDYVAALKASEEAYTLARGDKYIWELAVALYLTGVVQFKIGEIVSAESKLMAALKNGRRVNLSQVEADVLLALARLRAASQRVDKFQEEYDLAIDALNIAERCQFRLEQAESHNTLAEWWFAEADRRRRTATVVRPPSLVAEAIANARKHAEHAKERAWCDGPPYHYKVAYEKAERMLAAIEAVNSDQ